MTQNIVTLVGILSEFTRYSDKVGRIKLKVGDNHFYCTLFPPALEQMSEINDGCELKITGQLKNIRKEKDGKSVRKMDIIINTIEVLEEK